MLIIRKHFFVYSFIVFVSGFSPCVSQYTINTGGKKEATNEMIMMVKQFYQFIERFDYLKTPDDKSVDSLFKATVSRQQYIERLFNLDDKRLLSQVTESKNYQFLMQQFIADATILQAEKFLHRESELIFAKAECDATYNGKSCLLTLILQNRVVKNGGLKWEIAGVSSDILNMNKSEKLPQVSIPPNSQETNFLSMVKLLENKQNLNSLTIDELQYNPLHAFLFAMKENLIKIKNVKQVSFSVLEIDGWIIEIKEFTRNTNNSGWLISNILQVDQNGKDKYKKEVLFVY